VVDLLCFKVVRVEKSERLTNMSNPLIYHVSENKILLGAPFIYNTKLTLGYTSKGEQYIEFKNFNKEKVSKVCL
jgi:hypothetical protein